MRIWMMMRKQSSLGADCDHEDQRQPAPSPSTTSKRTDIWNRESQGERKRDILKQD